MRLWLFEKLSEVSGLPCKLTENLIEATSDCGAYVMVHGALKRTAVKLSKICNDLRLLSSGPRAGLKEINLPELQAGSSIMPAKVNPVIPGSRQPSLLLKVIGNDTTITFAAEAGQLQLNVMEPVIAYVCLKPFPSWATPQSTCPKNASKALRSTAKSANAMFSTHRFGHLSESVHRPPQRRFGRQKSAPKPAKACAKSYWSAAC